MFWNLEQAFICNSYTQECLLGMTAVVLLLLLLFLPFLLFLFFTVEICVTCGAHDFILKIWFFCLNVLHQIKSWPCWWQWMTHGMVSTVSRLSVNESRWDLGSLKQNPVSEVTQHFFLIHSWKLKCAMMSALNGQCSKNQTMPQLENDNDERSWKTMNTLSTSSQKQPSKQKSQQW